MEMINLTMIWDEMMVPTEAMPRPPTVILKEMDVGSPAWMKKYVGVPPMALPQKG